ncbi:hypothetical protein GCM10017667_58860 [Streptomyces filamentosus]|uniref:Uncharacterized protein n=1 Tax=Streptomyces filamentosus TaxID=67294 RepID=A0A919BW09_STRFL|nr:hypothetical protein GCM10017667_58860 [Streptomyces filamentosus]
MVGVVEEEDQVAQAYEGVGAVARPREGVGVAVHIADHVDSHAPTLGRRTCGYLGVGKAVDYCAERVVTTM